MCGQDTQSYCSITNTCVDVNDCELSTALGKLFCDKADKNK